jgi:transcriptional regulator with XRE-family HTH domain
VELTGQFASALAHLLAERDMSQRELARQIPIDAGFISRVLSGKRTVALSTAARCDEVLGSGDRLARAAEADLAMRRLVDPVGADQQVGPAAGETLPGLDPGLGSQLWEAYEALAGSQTTALSLEGIEAGVVWLHAHYADLAPRVLLPELITQTRLLTRALSGPQRIADRARLCSALGEIAGLRAWLMFDIGDLAASTAWFGLARRAALEAQDRDLVGWLCGAASLQPAYAGDHTVALEVIGQGVAVLPGDGGRTGAWLHALAARSHAALGAAASFEQEWRATGTDDGTGTRRHGMDLLDGRLDVGYYAGTALLGLRRPGQARQALTVSLAALPPQRVKARSVLSLAVAVSHAQDGDADHAAHLAEQALSLPADQCIDPIVNRVADVRAELANLRATEPLRRVEERIAQITTARKALPAAPSP